MFIGPLGAQSAPTPYIDSLEALLPSLPNDTNRLKVLRKLILGNMPLSAVEMQRYAEEFLNISRSLNLPDEETDAYNFMGVALSIQAKHESALAYFYEVEKRLLGAPQKSKLGRSYINAAGAHLGLREPAKALRDLSKARAIFAELKDTAYLLNIDIGIGQAMEKISERATAQQNTDLATRYTDSSYVYFQNALLQATDRRPNIKLLAYLGLAWHARQKNRASEAIDFAEKAHSLALSQQHEIHLSSTGMALGNGYALAGDYQRAIKFFDEALVYAQKTADVETQLDLFKTLSKTHASAGQFEQAYRFSVAYSVLLDSSATTEKSRAMADIETRYDRELLLRDRENLQKINQVALRNNGQLLTSVIILAIFLCGGMYLYIRLQRSQRRLDALNSAKDKLFSMIAHDLRGPLISVSGLTNKVDYLVKTNQLDRLHRLGEQIDGTMLRLKETLDNLLSWALSQQYRMTFRPEPFLLGEVLHRGKALYSTTAETKGIHLAIEVPEACSVFADHNGVDIIFRNLLSNAIKYSPHGGTIAVRVVEEPEHLLLSVNDQGIGIPPELLAQLMSSDINVSVPGTRGERGTGLGLGLCSQMARLGKMPFWGESKLGEGSTFFLRLKKSA